MFVLHKQTAAIVTLIFTDIGISHKRVACKWLNATLIIFRLIVNRYITTSASFNTRFTSQLWNFTPGTGGRGKKSTIKKMMMKLWSNRVQENGEGGGNEKIQTVNIGVSCSYYWNTIFTSSHLPSNYLKNCATDSRESLSFLSVFPSRVI